MPLLCLPAHAEPRTLYGAWGGYLRSIRGRASRYRVRDVHWPIPHSSRSSAAAAPVDAALLVVATPVRRSSSGTGFAAGSMAWSGRSRAARRCRDRGTGRRLLGLSCPASSRPRSSTSARQPALRGRARPADGRPRPPRPGGWCVPAAARATIPLPESIQACWPRLDTLEASERSIVAAAAIIGTVFWPARCRHSRCRRQKSSAMARDPRGTSARAPVPASSMAGETSTRSARTGTGRRLRSAAPRPRIDGICRATWIRTARPPGDVAGVVAHHLSTRWSLRSPRTIREQRRFAGGEAALADAATNAMAWMSRPRPVCTRERSSWHQRNAGTCRSPARVWRRRRRSARPRRRSRRSRRPSRWPSAMATLSLSPAPSGDASVVGGSPGSSMVTLPPKPSGSSSRWSIGHARGCADQPAAHRCGIGPGTTPAHSPNGNRYSSAARPASTAAALARRGAAR